MAGTVVILAGYWLGWLAVAVGGLATIYANVMSGLPYGHLAATVAAGPAVSFIVASFLLERWIKRQVSRGGQGGQEVAHLMDESSIAEPSPEPVLATPVPPNDSLNHCGHTVAGTAEENVVQAYLHERDCLGETPSQRRLSATHGISRPKVAALVGSLNGGNHDVHA